MKDFVALDRAVETVLTAGLAASALLLLAGLVGGSGSALRAGTVILMFTPVARVAVVATGMLARRDWAFGMVSLWVLGVLATSVAVAFHR